MFVRHVLAYIRDQWLLEGPVAAAGLKTSTAGSVPCVVKVGGSAVDAVDTAVRAVLLALVHYSDRPLVTRLIDQVRVRGAAPPAMYDDVALFVVRCQFVWYLCATRFLTVCPIPCDQPHPFPSLSGHVPCLQDPRPP